MNFKLVKTILLALSLGFFAVWVLEFRRAGMFESYWLLLLSVMCLLVFQFRRLKASMELKKKQTEEIENQKLSSSKPAKK
ncbi:hypothetical protein DSL64_14480 [Dyadobacter luteus]|uniref:Uncharacterized protein n=1 Tax=Dyadobacter luteus TaxID=2259619 RepID=A0A3D8YDV0_9BACT|nr:hypothetical protein [Dyadobacter luteus]REA60732.1 hypothetical protein DSL64_14480 [Dyadobacter luteus]